MSTLQELTGIASSLDLVFHVDDFTTLPSIETRIAADASSVCAPSKYLSDSWSLCE